MHLLTSVDSLSSVPGPVHLAIGFFDGVHAGHQEVIQHARVAVGAPARKGLRKGSVHRHRQDLLRPAGSLPENWRYGFGVAP